MFLLKLRSELPNLVKKNLNPLWKYKQNADWIPQSGIHPSYTHTHTQTHSLWFSMK